MRIFRLLLLIVALIVGQAQASRAVYVCVVDGGVCKRCSAERGTGHGDICRSVTKKSADNKNCCKAKPDADHQESQKAAPPHPAEAPAGILTPSLRFELPASVPRGAAPQLRYVSYLPLAPPGEQSLRAPPFLSV